MNEENEEIELTPEELAEVSGEATPQDPPAEVEVVTPPVTAAVEAPADPRAHQAYVQALQDALVRQPQSQQQQPDPYIAEAEAIALETDPVKAELRRAQLASRITQDNQSRNDYQRAAQQKDMTVMTLAREFSAGDESVQREIESQLKGYDPMYVANMRNDPLARRQLELMGKGLKAEADAKKPAPAPRTTAPTGGVAPGVTPTSRTITLGPEEKVIYEAALAAGFTRTEAIKEARR